MKIPTAKLPFATKKPRSRPFTFRTRPLTAAVLGTIIDEYDVGMAHVIVSDSGEKHTYSVQEPPLSETEQGLYSLLMESLYYSLKPIETDDPGAYVDQFIWQAAEDLGAVEEVKRSYNSLKYYIMRDSVGYGVVDVLVRDDDIEEISCEGACKALAVVHRRYPQFDWLDTNIVFDDEETLKKFVQRLVQKAGKAITTSVPFVDAITKENHRLAATLSNEISLPGSTFDMRKFPKEPLSIGHLLAAGTISPLLAAYYWMIVEEKGFVLVIGPTASGKTTTMNALITLINPALKIATVEESVTKHAKVLVKRGGKIERIKIGWLVDSFLAENGNYSDQNGFEYTAPNNLEVLTADLVNKKIVWGKCNKLIRHKAHKTFVSVKTNRGKAIEVTEDHSLFTLDKNGEIAPVKCGTLKKGDIIVVPKSIPNNENNCQVFILSSLPELSEYTLVKKGNDWFIKAPHSNGNGILPNKIVINEDIGFLAGIWLSDGCYDKRSVLFSVLDKGFDDYLYSILTKLGLKGHIASDRITLQINSLPLKVLFQSVLQLRGYSNTKFIPKVFFDAPDAVVASLLRGYFSGDGSISRGEVEVESISKQLIYDIQTLLLQFKIQSKISLKRNRRHKPIYRLAIVGKNDLLNFKEKIGFVPQEKNDKIAQLRTKTTKWYIDSIPLVKTFQKELKTISVVKNKTINRIIKCALERKAITRDVVLTLGEYYQPFKNMELYKYATSDLAFEDIVSVKKAVKEEYVYDISVPETNTFIANNIVAHNTPELLIPQEHWERLHSRTSYSATADTRYDVDLFDLAKLTLRLRPDYIVVGEARGEEISTLFQAASTGHGALSSFHADSPEAALVRMAAPPLNVGTASLMLMWSLLMMNRIRMNDGSVVRRALVSKEVGMKGELIDMFRWSPKEDTILPADPLEIAQKSYRLQAVAALKGWSVDALAAELAGRAKYLSNIVRSGAYKYADVSAAIHRFYREKYGGRTTKISD
ncbi:MAG: Flp pilus assembly complex ATPase component TadA [Nitrososphaerota archaeon]|nr:Flp pilus assembly complex ATPase component TadA [Nitrososphaerota archaeon]